MKIVTVAGARPQFVKAAAVSREIAETPGLEEVFLHTGQHFDREMSEVFFEELRLPRPKYNLGINSAGHGQMTGRMLEGIEKVLLAERPDAVMVYGDTNSTLAGALAARKLHINLIHVEAGLRSFNLGMPEEVNRVLTDRISDLLCCPTAKAVENLRLEGFDRFGCVIARTGDVMQDAVLLFRTLASRKSAIRKTLDLSEGRPYALCTVHREENTDDRERLSSIVAALNAIAREMPVVLPLHPRTRKALQESGIPLGFRPVDPVGYLDMIQLTEGSAIVLTDSGGLQKEAFFLRRPCVTLRDETEWVELVEGGYNRLAGAGTQEILRCFGEMRDAAPDYDANLYGGGHASRNVVESITSHLSSDATPRIRENPA